MSARDIIEALEREAHLVVPLLFATLFVALPAFAQPPLSLSEAIARAKARNPDAGSTRAAEREAAERVTQVRGDYFAKVDVAESWQRGNHPVFVFSSLLVQRRFIARADRELAGNRRDAGQAAATVDAAKAAFLPQVAAQGGWERNGAAWNSRSSSWVAGAVVRINLFHGLADKARLAVQIAIARLEAARASEAVGRAAADRAREMNVLLATATLQRGMGRP